MAKKIVKNESYDIDLDYVNLAKGENKHDYESTYIWYGDSKPLNSDLGLKMRCKNCGRVIPLSRKRFMDLFEKYKITYSRNNHDFDYEALKEEILYYEIPEVVGPFDIRYIYDDGSMRIRPLGYKQKEILISKDGEILQDKRKKVGSKK